MWLEREDSSWIAAFGRALSVAPQSSALLITGRCPVHLSRFWPPHTPSLPVQGLEAPQATSRELQWQCGQPATPRSRLRAETRWWQQAALGQRPAEPRRGTPLRANQLLWAWGLRCTRKPVFSYSKRKGQRAEACSWGEWPLLNCPSLTFFSLSLF